MIIIFFLKYLKIFSVVNIWQHLATKFCPKSALSIIVKIATTVRLKKVVTAIILIV
jgi:hypothetical protein